MHVSVQKQTELNTIAAQPNFLGWKLSIYLGIAPATLVNLTQLVNLGGENL